MELFRHSLGWNVALARPDNILNFEQDNLLRGIDKYSGMAQSVFTKTFDILPEIVMEYQIHIALTF